jgi:hypothetical protein
VLIEQKWDLEWIEQAIERVTTAMARAESD